jgi:hypothetical protein
VDLGSEGLQKFEITRLLEAEKRNVQESPSSLLELFATTYEVGIFENMRALTATFSISHVKCRDKSHVGHVLENPDAGQSPLTNFKRFTIGMLHKHVWLITIR